MLQIHKSLKNCQRSFSRFLLVEAEAVEAKAEEEAIGVEAEAIDEIAASTSLVTIKHGFGLTTLH